MNRGCLIDALVFLVALLASLLAVALSAAGLFNFLCSCRVVFY